MKLDFFFVLSLSLSIINPPILLIMTLLIPLIDFRQVIRFRRFLNSKTENAPDVAKPTFSVHVPLQNTQRAFFVVLQNGDAALFVASTFYHVGNAELCHEELFRGLVVDVDMEINRPLGGDMFVNETLWGDLNNIKLPLSWTWAQADGRKRTRWGTL